MRFRTYSIGAVLLLCLCAGAWAEVRVQGAVFGVWAAGDTVSLEGPVNIPSGKGLTVEPGVVILPKTVDPVLVYGFLDAQGTAEFPIIIIPVEGWAGFSFQPNSEDRQILRYVVIPDLSPEPSRVVTAHAARVVIEFCRFHAALSCLDFTNGRMQAVWNMLRTTGMYSKTVRLNYLDNFSTNACDNPDGNRFSDNIVKVVVPADCTGGPFDSFTAALYINGSTNLCLRRNALSVLAPSSVIGAYFGMIDPGEGVASNLDSAVVTVRSYSGTARGIYNAIEGALRVLHCSIDVGIIDTESSFRPQAIIASQMAFVNVNSSTIVLDRDSAFFVPVSGGMLQVDHITRWSITTHDLSAPVPHAPLSPIVQGDLNLDDPILSVIWGPNCYYADPLFLRQGEWGAWTNFAQVEAYYGINAMSPCIDTADTLWGYDPDHTLPDIGRYYYPQFTDASDRDDPVVASVALAPAYPNPFNNSTTIPFALQRAGNVRMVAFDVLGRQVAVIDAGRLSPGSHHVLLNANGFASGLYIVQVEVEGAPVAQQRVILLK